MPKTAKELQALEVARLTAPGLHMVGVVRGLALQIKNGGRSWVLRVTIGGKRRDVGLGPFPEVTLAQARNKARELRDQIERGIDPVAARTEAARALKAQNAAALTFRQCAEKFIKANRAGWKNEKHAQQWENTLEQHAYPVLGELLVRDVALPHVLQVLEPIWTTKNETASRLRGRVESVLDWATTRELRKGPNPARWRGNLDKLLPKPSKVAAVQHHPAVAVADVGAFMVRLREAQGLGARALEFAILTAARSGEVRGATWGEMDLDAGLWVVPASLMKAGREHRVPLSTAALALLATLPKGKPDELVFPAARGGMLSDMTLSAVMRRLQVPAVPHGFRSTFRDWAGERTNHPHELAEMALAHVVSDKTEAAYRRGDLLAKRRVMMEEWAAFVAKVERPAQVVEFKGKAA